MPSPDPESKKVYTRTGDLGLTSLRTGERVAKSDIRVAICGEADELNSYLGLASSLSNDSGLKQLVSRLQNEVLSIAGRLQTPSLLNLEAERIAALEAEIDNLSEELDPINYFILPGGSPAAAACHVARTVCRRVERSLVGLEKQEPVPGTVLQYFNRLADLLFVLARAFNHREGVPDIRWENQFAGE